MQYPIIDTLIDAYTRNGWTGLGSASTIDLKPFLERGTLSNDGMPVPSLTRCRTSYINCLPESEYTFTVDADKYIYEIHQYTSDYAFISLTSINNSSATIITRNNTAFIRVLFRYPNTTQYMTPDDFIIATMKSDNMAPNTDEISHRLKLPLPHYFPHPGIDALQRAAAGTQTADDTEILRHYLTPLGIGGI